MIVEARKRKHRDEAYGEPANLLHVHAGERTAVRGGINFNHAQCTDRGKDGQQPPIVITCSRCFLHDSCALTAKIIEVIAGPRVALRGPQQQLLWDWAPV